ncbi:ABC transporter ATP-binding protein [Aliagarivorans taiwanensis]|uniref:ABC transporter ATP-binding protein n=1 Tax=Aliagarivorans taiwanensis TaxID=561966 RepID=UPI00040F11BB|nr:oligopeptide/dipeptide ABC transporter ATP-binding protein [Aliagarivorans taiwanensis]
MVESVVSVENLQIKFDVSVPLLSRLLKRKPKTYVHAVRGVDFSIKKGETFSLVGESGCGKSTVAKLLSGLHKPSDGSVVFKGHDLVSLSRSKLKEVRRGFQMIFQDPYASLNPRWKVADIIGEPIDLFGLADSKQHKQAMVIELLHQVGLSGEDRLKYPHEFSGGQRQRISIARALASKPEFLICDEPTSALDVSVQAQVLNIMSELQEKLGLTYLFISHDMSVVSHFSDRVGIMYLGRLVEVGEVADIFNSPKHPYTKMLMEAIPSMDEINKERTPVSGEVPSPLNPPSGCAFHPRCPNATHACASESPVLRDLGERSVACLNV